MWEIGSRGTKFIYAMRFGRAYISVDYVSNEGRRDYHLPKKEAVDSRGDHSLLYFAYTCVQGLFIGGVIYLAKKIIR
jgi:hypothetical protein